MKRKKNLKIIIILVQVLVIITIFTNTVCASGYYGIYEKTANPFSASIADIIGVAQAVGMCVAVIMLVIIGIKYLFVSPEGKAEVKKQLFPYLIGCVLLFGGSWIIGIIAQVAYDNIK